MARFAGRSWYEGKIIRLACQARVRGPVTVRKPGVRQGLVINGVTLRSSSTAEGPHLLIGGGLGLGQSPVGQDGSGVGPDGGRRSGRMGHGAGEPRGRARAAGCPRP